jgi:hypothetical protein
LSSLIPKSGALSENANPQIMIRPYGQNGATRLTHKGAKMSLSGILLILTLVNAKPLPGGDAAARLGEQGEQDTKVFGWTKARRFLLTPFCAESNTFW